MRPSDCKYLKSHEWVKVVEDDIALIGITDYAASHLKDVVYVEPSDVGTDIMQNEPFGEIESVKAVSDLISPVTAEILEHNEELLADYGLLQKDPFGKAWIIKVRIENPKEFDNLLDAEGYEQAIKEEEG